MSETTAPVLTPRGIVAAHLPAVVAYALLTLVQLWPMVVAIDRVVPSDLGDPLLSTWTLWWNAREVPFSAGWWDGLAFFPAAGTLALSDHRVGLGLIATPILWLGGSPVLAYNVTFAATYLLSALAAYALAFTLTGNRAASFVGGLAFGFHPFRAEHLPHLELLAAYWLPIILLALHRWADSPRRRWPVLLAVALTMQALTCGYYFVYFAPLLGLWLLWFTPRGLPVRRYTTLAAALIVPLLLIAPVLAEYRHVHQRMGLARSITEIEQLSADAIGLLTAPEPLAFWNAPDSWRGPEGSLFPGLTAVLLVGIAVVLSRRDPAPSSSRVWIVGRRVLLAGVVVGLAAAALPIVRGPSALEFAGLRISVSNSYKPFSTATVLFIAWLLTSARLRQAWRQRTAFPFYVLATLAMWLFAFGPTARLLGERVLYKPPYSWLMVLPGFRDGFRAPARFAMLAAVTLSIAAAIAFWHLVQRRGWTAQAAAFAIIVAGIVVDSWIAPFRVVAAPAPLTMPSAVPADAVVLQLPVGVFEDAETMYRSMTHHRRLLNGMSGYEPPHYPILRLSLEEGRTEALSVFAGHADLAIFVPRDEAGVRLAALIRRDAGAESVAVTDRHEVLLVDRTTPRDAAVPPGLRSIRAASIASLDNPEHLSLLNDGERQSTWVTPEPQAGGEQLVADAGDVIPIAGVTLSLGRSMTAFPRGLRVEVSAGDGGWIDVWRGDMAAASVAAAIADPRDVTTVVSFPVRQARFVRLTQTGASTHPWAVSELRLLTPEN